MSSRQTLTVVGQVVGAYFGPIGSAIGGAIGGYIGGMIDGPQKGPRLDDTAAPTIEFGGKVPRVYGRVWCTLSPLWWSGLRESTVNSDGKGASADQTTDNFIYHCDMLGRLADGANVIGWTRIRIDGKIVASQLADSSAETLAATANTERWSDVELRSGASDQMPWSVMEAAEGAGNVSAYRDQCTFAFTNLLMQNGRNPSLIEVEVITAGAASVIGGPTGLLCDFNGAGAMALSAESSIGPDVVGAAGTSLSAGAGIISVPGESFGASGITGILGAFWRIEAKVLRTQVGGHVFWVRNAASGKGVMIRNQIAGLVGIDGFQFEVVNNNAGISGTAVPVTYVENGLGEFHYYAAQWDGFNLSFFLDGVYQYAVGVGSNDWEGVSFDTFSAGANGFGSFAGSIGFIAFNPDLAPEDLYSTLGYSPIDPVLPWGDEASTVYVPETVDLQEILEAEMLRCSPLTAGDIDMSAAAGKQVWGFKASRSAAAECAVLCDWYYLDLFCGDKITVVERGGAVEQTIPYGYTGSAIDGTSDPFAGLIRGADVEIQFATAVQYINILADGEVDTQNGQRLGTGSEVRSVNFSIYSKASEAKGRADTITHDTRVAAHTATVRLGAKQAASIRPASVLRLVDNKGNSYRTRALRLVWNRGVYEIDVCLDDPNILKTVGITTEVDTSVIEVEAPPVAEFLPLDIPRVSDAQNAPGYAALVKTDTSAGARWFDSPDDVTYTSRFDFANDAVFGAVTAASGDFGRGVLFDEGSSLTVDVGDGALSSATRDALLADRFLNLFAVGVDGRMVLGQFRTATQVSPGMYALGGFVNMGFKGTERFCSSIEAGDDFAMMGIAGTAQIARSLTDLGVPFHVKAAAFGASLANVAAVEFTASGVNLSPLSPVLLRAERDASTGDIAISWTRQTRGDTRFGGPLGDACPVFETAELYRVRLYTDGTYATVLRDLGTPTTSTVTYTAAQRATDGHTLTAPLYVGVAMVSDLVGEGHPLQDAA